MTGAEALKKARSGAFIEVEALMLGRTTHLSQSLRGVLRLAGALASGVCLCLLAEQQAAASNKITTGATNVSLAVVDANTAVISYRAHGQSWSVTAAGGINARLPNRTVPQVGFQMKYSQSGGSAGRCGRYDGPPLAWLVAACKGANGDYWAVQAWQRNLPNYGAAPRRPEEGELDLRLSHWKGALPVFTVKTDWTYHRYDHLYGSLTYLGKPMFGFGTTTPGNPTDKYGVLIYLDTRDPAYGPGWRRENSFVTHNPSGIFCYGFFPHSPHPAGTGKAYRTTVVGPGVLPDLMWQGAAPGPYNAAKDETANADQRAHYADRSCRPN